MLHLAAPAASMPGAVAAGLGDALDGRVLPIGLAVGLTLRHITPATGLRALILSPTRIYRLWGIALVLCVLWPGTQEIWDRIGGVPVEYVPFLAIMLFGCLSGLHHRKLLIPSRPRCLLVISCGILAYAFASQLWARDYRAWLTAFSMWALYLGAFWGIINSLSNTSWNRVLRLLDSLLLASAVFSSIGIARSFALGTIGTAAHYSPLIRYPYIEAFLVLPFIPLAIALYVTTYRVRYALMVIIFIMEVMLLFSRTGIVGLLLTLLLSLVVYGRQLLSMIRRHFAHLCAFAFAVLIIPPWVAGTDTNWLVQRSATRIYQVSLAWQVWFGDSTGVSAVNPDDVAGQVWFTEAIRIFSLHPYIGTGAGNYAAYYNAPPPFSEPTRARNFYASYLAEFGILGFIVIFAFIAYLLYWLWDGAARVRNTALRVLALSFPVGHAPILVMLMGEEFISTPYVWFYWGLAVACVICIRRHDQMEWTTVP